MNNGKKDHHGMQEKVVEHQAADLLKSVETKMLSVQKNLNMYHHEHSIQNDKLDRMNDKLNNANAKIGPSQKRYADLYDLAPVAYLILDLDGYIQSANEAFCALVGEEKKVVCQHKLSRFLVNQSQDVFRWFMQETKWNINQVEKLNLVFHGKDGDTPTEVYAKYDEENGSYFISATILDITENKRLLQQIEQEQERYQIIAKQANNILFEYQIQQDTMVYSSRFTELTGREPIIQDFINYVKQDDYIFEEDLPKVEQLLAQIEAGQENMSCNLRFRRAKGVYVWYKIMASILFDGKTPIKVIGTMTDIDDAVKANEVLKKAAQRDALTQLLNKMTAETTIEAYLRGEGRQGNHALMIVDIDNFKTVNDRLGRLFGDAALSEIAVKLRNVIHPEDIVGRIGGDEFVVLLKQRESREAVAEIADEVCGLLRNILFSEQNICNISGSIGLCLYPQDASTYDDLFRKADIALYNAKLRGKNRFVFYSGGLHQGIGNVELLNRYEEAMPHQERQYANLTFVTNVIELLFAGKVIASSMQLILSMIGNYFKVDHVCLAESKENEKYWEITYRWYKNDKDERMSSLKTVPNTLLANYEKMFNSEGLFCSSDLSILCENNEALWKEVTKIGIKSTLQCAFLDDGKFRGFIALDNYEYNRIWRQDDINSFMLIGKTIGAYLTKLRMQQRSERFAVMDMLTSVWNINKFTIEANQLLRISQSNSALISLDIRNFTYFNDRYGYAEGDRILVAFSRRLRAMLSEDEMLARMSADQFVALLSFKSEEELYSRMETILSSLRILPRKNNKFYKMAIICGVCIVKPEDTNISVIIDRANAARKSVKKSHKSIVAYYNEALENKLAREKLIEDAMEDALANGEFYVVYQPKIFLADGTIAGAEALIRWNSPVMGQIYPDSFIPIVEKNGFVVELDFFVLTQVCKKIKQWQAALGQNICVSVNFSRVHVNIDQSIERARQIVDMYQVPPHLVEIEITESAFVSDAEALQAYITRFREAGFRIAMDDFGAGYSSLNLLKDLPLDVLKIDRNFFRSDCITEREKIVVNSVVRMAHQLGIVTVAEGVETADQAKFLREIGCEIVQGYLFAKPMAVEEFECNWLKSQ